MEKQVTIIGSGFSSLSAACYLARAGYEVNVFEKNKQLGGRAMQFIQDEFKFDMGPTWYWMPDVFDRFFEDLGKRTENYYQIEKLNPAYRVYFDEGDYIDIEDSIDKIKVVFEKYETGAAEKLQKFMDKAERNYEIAIQKLVYQPGISPLELVTLETAKEIKQFILTIRDIVHKEFKHPKLRQVLEFPVLFLGAKSDNTPAFYSFMNHADFGLGTWYPKGGMRSVVEGFVKLGEELGVQFHTNSPVSKIIVEDGVAQAIMVNEKKIEVTHLISGADYKHSETLLPPAYRQYTDSYWGKRIMAPSSLLFYVGFNKKLKNVLHHTLFFDTSFDVHAKDIYDTPKWPDNPLFYASFPSITDDSISPEGQEAGTFLIPLAPDLEDTPELRKKYFDIIINRLERLTNQNVRESIIFNKSYCVNDFKADYNSYKGNAYGLANTLFQTAFLRPKLKSRKVKNLLFTGQLTVPGPGVPPAIISGKIVAELLTKQV